MTTPKTPLPLRQFRCIDALWQVYLRRAEALGCPVDRLINEALAHYARAFTPPPSPPPLPPPPRQLRLTLIFNNQRIPVAADPFVIGRRASGCNLVIRDGNISRRHAAIIRRNGTYYIKDLGSTNGVTFRGARIDNKRIDEGDLFVICDHELRFTYRGATGSRAARERR
jgi:ribosomal protein L36